MNRSKGFTLLELLVVISIGAFIFLITGSALNNVTKVFLNTSGRDTAMRDLAKARRALTLDLSQATLNQLAITPAPASLGGAPDGDAVDFLSAVNGTDGSQASLLDGSGNAYYFQNIVYYVTTPTNHDALFGITCVGGSDGGYEFNCPHKVLLRLVEDQNPTYDPGDQTTQDSLLSPLTAVLTRPTGFPKTVNRDTVAINLLTFQVQKSGAELIVDLRAVSIPDARRKVAIGAVSLRNSPYTIQHRFSVFPKN